MLGTVLATRFRAALPDRLSQLGLPASLREQVIATVGAGQHSTTPGGPRLASALRQAGGEAFISGAHTGWAIAALALLASSLLAAALLPRTSSALTAPAAAPTKPPGLHPQPATAPADFNSPGAG